MYLGQGHPRAWLFSSFNFFYFFVFVLEFKSEVYNTDVLILEEHPKWQIPCLPTKYNSQLEIVNF